MHTPSFPISKIIFYCNGFTSFERICHCKGPTALDLYFKSSELEQVVQSLSVTSSNPKVKISSVSYQATKPKESDLQKSSIRLENVCSGEAIPSLIQSLRGARVLLSPRQPNKQSVEGILLGTYKSEPHSSASTQHVGLYLTQSGTMTYFPLAEYDIIFLDETIRNELQFALQTKISTMNQDLLKVTVFTQCNSEEESYDLMASYSLQFSPWTSSYRLTLDDKDKTVGYLEAFANLKNEQEEDWNNVECVVVTGVPMIQNTDFTQGGDSSRSFVVQFSENVNPNNSFGIRCESSDTIEALKSKIQSHKGYHSNALTLVFNGKQLEEGRTLSDYNIVANSNIKFQVSKEMIGNDLDSATNKLFRLADTKNLSFYHTGKITVKRNQSALVSILYSKLSVNHCLLFNPAIRKGNPLNAFTVQNTTGYMLNEGSLIIKDKKLTIGETLFEKMEILDETMLQYAVELSVELAVKVTTRKTKPYFVEIRNGEIFMYRNKILEHEYSLNNKSDTQFPLVYLDHLFAPGYSLYEKSPNFSSPIDITDRFYRFEFPLNAKAKKVFTVMETSVDIKTISVASIRTEQLQKKIKKGYFTTDLKPQFESLMEISKKDTKLMTDIYVAETKLRQLKEEEDRIRKNIEVLRNDDKKAKYIKDLEISSDTIDQLNTNLKTMREEKSLLTQKYNEASKSIVATITLPNNKL